MSGTTVMITKFVHLTQSLYSRKLVPDDFGRSSKFLLAHGGLVEPLGLDTLGSTYGTPVEKLL